MGLPWNTTSVEVLTTVASATQSAALPPMAEGTGFALVFCIIGYYIDFHRRK